MRTARTTDAGRPVKDGRKTDPVVAGRGGLEGDLATRDPILTTRVGLRFPPDLTFDRWEQAGRHITRVIDSAAWYLGDWLLYGQERYSDRYRRAVEAAGLDYQTLRNYAWVTRRFALSRRRETLSFQHHAEVASLPEAEQDRWLDSAERLGWSRNELRHAVRGHQRQLPGDESRPARLPRLAVPAERMKSWREAAEQADSDLSRWIVETLDRAAAQVLAQEAKS